MDNGLCCLSEKICGNWCCKEDEYCEDTGLTKFCKTICPEGSSVVGTGDKAGDTSCSCETAAPAWNGTACVACPTGSSLIGTGAETGVGSCKCDDSSYTWNASEGLCKAESNCMQKDDGSILCCDNGEKPYKYDSMAEKINGNIVSEYPEYFTECCANDPYENFYRFDPRENRWVGPLCCSGQAKYPVLAQEDNEGNTFYGCFSCTTVYTILKQGCDENGENCTTFTYSDEPCNGDLHLYNLEEFYGYPEYAMACDRCMEYGMLSCGY